MGMDNVYFQVGCILTLHVQHMCEIRVTFQIQFVQCFWTGQFYSTNCSVIDDDIKIMGKGQFACRVGVFKCMKVHGGTTDKGVVATAAQQGVEGMNQFTRVDAGECIFEGGCNPCGHW